MSSSLESQTALDAAANRKGRGKDTLAAYISASASCWPRLVVMHGGTRARYGGSLSERNAPPLSSAGSRSIRILRDNDDRPLPTRAYTQHGRLSQWCVCVRMILEPVKLTLLRDGSTAYPEPLTLKGPLNMALKYIDYTDYVHIHRLLCLNTFYLYQEDCGVMPTR